jgi:CheY-like chemotaxis protein
MPNGLMCLVAPSTPLLVELWWGGRADADQPGWRPRADDIAAEQPAAAAEVDLGPILIVDDDAALRRAVSAVLEDSGYPVVVAADGAAALRAIEQHRPSLVLLDMRMPILNGWDLARALEQRGIELPIVVMTAAQDATAWATEIGAAGHLAKPFELPELLDVVERLREHPV